MVNRCFGCKTCPNLNNASLGHEPAVGQRSSEHTVGSADSAFNLCVAPPFCLSFTNPWPSLRLCHHQPCLKSPIQEVPFRPHPTPINHLSFSSVRVNLSSSWELQSFKLSVPFYPPTLCFFLLPHLSTLVYMTCHFSNFGQLSKGPF